jgi:hypothetical protein
VAKTLKLLDAYKTPAGQDGAPLDAVVVMDSL